MASGNHPFVFEVRTWSGKSYYRSEENQPSRSADICSKASDTESSGGLGIAVLYVRGIMSDKAARQEGIGGEVLCYIW